MLAWLRAALREVVVVSASPVIAQPHAWRSAGSGWRCLPGRNAATRLDAMTVEGT
jgi:hypothetical protein